MTRYSSPTVLNAMYQSTGTPTPMQVARVKHQQNIENQFRERKQNIAQQQADINQRELMRRIVQDVHKMDKDKREQMRTDLADKTSEALYAKEQGPEAWARLMQRRKMNVPFEEADKVIAPGVGMGKVFENVHKYEKRKADAELERAKLDKDKDKRTTFQRNLAELTKDNFMTREEAVEYLNTQPGKSDAAVEQELMSILMRSDEGKGMSRNEAREWVKDKVMGLKQLREEMEAEDPDNPLGLSRGGGFTGANVYTR